jgi:hypothetical protein
MLGRVLAAFAVAIMTFGCGAGKEAAMTQPSAGPAKIESGTWQGSKGNATITLSLAADGRFQVVFRGGDYRSVVKGEASVSNSTLELHAKDFEGRQPVTKGETAPIRFKISGDWQSLEAENGIQLMRKI